MIEVHLDLDGYPVTLLDTAGIRDSDDPVEQEGVRRARERAAAADLVLWVEDASEPNEQGRDEAKQRLFQATAEVWLVLGTRSICCPRIEEMNRNNEYRIFNTIFRLSASDWR